MKVLERLNELDKESLVTKENANSIWFYLAVVTICQLPCSRKLAPREVPKVVAAEEYSSQNLFFKKKRPKWNRLLIHKLSLENMQYWLKSFFSCWRPVDKYTVEGLAVLRQQLLQIICSPSLYPPEAFLPTKEHCCLPNTRTESNIYWCFIFPIYTVSFIWTDAVSLRQRLI